MKILKLKAFHKWAMKCNLTDDQLATAVQELEKGLFDASLGSNIYKKRISLKGKGKRGGARTLVAYKEKKKTVFLYAFEKKDKANISKNEKEALRVLGNLILDLSDKDTLKKIKDGSLVEIKEG